MRRLLQLVPSFIGFLALTLVGPALTGGGGRSRSTIHSGRCTWPWVSLAGVLYSTSWPA